MEEIWKPILDKYWISNRGRIRRGNNFLATPISKQGYPMIVLRVDGKAKGLYVHHLVLDAFVGPKPKGKECNHIDGVKTNNIYTNLEWVSRGRNLSQAYRMGLAKGSRVTRNQGIKNVHSLLDEQQVREIRELTKDVGLSHSEIAQRFGVSKSVISDVKLRKTWKHVT